MDSYLAVIFVYILGGLTLPPIILLLILSHAYLTFPIRASNWTSKSSQDEGLRRPGDDEEAFKPGTADLPEAFKTRSHEADVAAGYFAVCREYVPGGVNGKPPERTTPAGEVIATESPSVYQSMYRSIFDRNKTPTMEPVKGFKRARNVFYVVLRHGHLMLYDDSEQLEVRHVISLAHHDVGIYGGDGGHTPEGELWIKRNAICLTRRHTGTNTDVETKPFFLFSDNCSDKEDFYLALVQNQDRNDGKANNPPSPLRFEVKDIVSLVQNLHSSEEQMQTRWFNGIAGRLFLALYKTSELEALVREKITKKISRVKKPAFLTEVVIQKIDLGRGSPHITNPRLKDLNVDGECSVEMDVDYSGHFKLEVATKARLELGSRFKAREVDLVLSVVMERFQGHCIARIKPPPSNRIWVTFESMPKMQMTLEPIVSSRQITYNIILRAIESRIREVIAETVVLPNWDDIPFADTTNQRFRGGLWAPEDEEIATDKEAVSELLTAESSHQKQSPNKPKDIPTKLVDAGSVTSTTQNSTLSDASQSMSSRKSIGSIQARPEDDKRSSASNIEQQRRLQRKPSWRSGSFAGAAMPVVGTDKTTVDAVRGERQRGQHNATSAMIAISARSQTTSPVESPVGSPSTSAEMPEQQRGSLSSTSSKDSNHHERIPPAHNSTPESSTLSSLPTTPTSINGESSMKALPGFGYDSKSNKSTLSLAQVSLGASSKSKNSKRPLVAGLGAATASVARKWGWGGGVGAGGASNKDRQPSNIIIDETHEPGETTGKEGTPSNPIGRGQPLPPPGTPLPLPAKPKRTLTGTAPKRKPVPSVGPLSLQVQTTPNSDHPTSAAPTLQVAATATGESTAKKRPSHGEAEGLLVVAAPSTESSPPTPVLLLRDDDDQSEVHLHQPFEMDEDVSLPSETLSSSVAGQQRGGEAGFLGASAAGDAVGRMTHDDDHSVRRGSRMHDDQRRPPNWMSAVQQDQVGSIGALVGTETQWFFGID
ncbi:MAG: hypothetical protein M1816_008260 [Peltula sp. TS41687]|nr:MAG: hypothetical protein M1816_008260 [Peltula sp. TS41687]